MLIVILPCPLPRFPTFYLVEMGSWPPAPLPDPGILAVLSYMSGGSMDSFFSELPFGFLETHKKPIFYYLLIIIFKSSLYI